MFQSEVLHQASFDSSYQASIQMPNSSFVHQAILQVEQIDRHKALQRTSKFTEFSLNPPKIWSVPVSTQNAGKGQDRFEPI